MNHHTTPEFWKAYEKLPIPIQKAADSAFALLKSDPSHPSPHFKKIRNLWSVRIGLHYRAQAVDSQDGPIWFWIGTHADYDKLIQQRLTANKSMQPTTPASHNVMPLASGSHSQLTSQRLSDIMFKFPDQVASAKPSFGAVCAAELLCECQARPPG